MLLLLAAPSLILPCPSGTLIVYDSTVCPIEFPSLSSALMTSGISHHPITITGVVVDIVSRLILSTGHGSIWITCGFVIQESVEAIGAQICICNAVLPAFLLLSLIENVSCSVNGL